jgi:Zn-dependent protease
MPSGRPGIRLFRLAGIDVFLHWSWFVVALYEIQGRTSQYGSVAWNAAEYVALFLMVTLHEFGHSLACRQVGGETDHIVLWPLGGVAYVRPPQRPGATLWSLAAGPLVNVALIPLLFGAILLSRALGLAAAVPDADRLLHSLAIINVGLLVFNLLPIYPLDGGKILRSLLWFFLGRANSLTAATAVGFLGVLGLAGLALLARSPWLGIMAAYIGMNCWQGFQQARALSRLAKLPRHHDFACPSCRSSPPAAALWICPQCQKPFDTFETNAACPSCGSQFATTTCVDCGGRFPMTEWAAATPPQGASAR